MELTWLLQAGLSPFPYDRAALLIAVDEHRDLDFPACESRLDGFALRVQQSVRPDREQDARERIGALRRVLFEEEGFHGNRREYYDVRNSYLHEVLERRLGIPISLGVLCLGVARRVGWDLEPVNFPSHFLLRWVASDEVLAIDPFNGALVLGEDDLREMWRTATARDAPEPANLLRAAQPREVVARMLNNIWIVHRAHARYRPASLALEKLALLFPEHPAYERDVGSMRLAAGDLQGALSSFERYLERAPHAEDAPRVLRDSARLRAALGSQS